METPSCLFFQHYGISKVRVTNEIHLGLRLHTRDLSDNKPESFILPALRHFHVLACSRPVTREGASSPPF